MTLESGRMLGPYEITVPAGAGGMGEVYKARDTRLDRTVAIKVLPQRTALNSDLRARFEREAKAISSLNHPNICTLYDVGHENGTDYLVMEYIEGESLSERLKKGPMPIDESLQIALQVAEALTSAHGKGLVHRDLKPANIMLTKDGAKLLDFGLAKLKVSSGVVEGVTGITQSTPLTGTGTIVGTIQYMSPEQLEGSEADHRSDIFAFGAVLYEMIAGQRPFEGKSQASIIAAIIEREPSPLSAVKPMSPPGLDRLVKKCLQKDPSARWQSARDMADEIRWLSQGGSQVGIPAPLSRRRRLRFHLAWAVAFIGLCSTAVLAAMWLTQPKPQPRVRRYVMQQPAGLAEIRWPRISPDGTALCFQGIDSSGRTMIWVRPLNSLESNPLPGTEDAGRPFWSPDSKWLGYFSNGGQLKKVPVAGGPVQFLGEAHRGTDGSWGRNNLILFDGSSEDSIRALSATGGEARAMTRIDRSAGELYHAWPITLPDNNHFLYLVSGDSLNRTVAYRLVVGSYDTDEKRVLRTVNSNVVYSSEGYVLFLLDNTLVAQRFDLVDLTLSGEPVPIAEDIRAIRGSGGADFSVSDDGTLVYQSTSGSDISQLLIVNRQGVPIDTLGPPDKYGDIRLSPDARFVAYSLEDVSGSSDIWIRDRRREVVTKLTFDPMPEFNPVWSADGKDIFYTIGYFPGLTTLVRAASGIGGASRVFGSDTSFAVVSSVADDNQTLTTIIPAGNQVDLALVQRGVSLAGARYVATSTFDEFQGTVSPDGRYLAYVSEESGDPEVYVTRIDGVEGRWQVSFGGGLEPKWNSNGKELFYFTGRRVMVVPVETGEVFELGQSIMLFEFEEAVRPLQFSQVDVSRDGQQILINQQVQQEQQQQFVVVQDWTAELKADN